MKNGCVYLRITQVYEDGVLLGGELLEQLLVGHVIGWWPGGDSLPEQVLLREKLPNLASVLPRDACRRGKKFRLNESGRLRGASENDNMEKNVTGSRCDAPKVECGWKQSVA